VPRPGAWGLVTKHAIEQADRLLATSSTSATSRALMSLYGKRWGMECGLRNTKDSRFGMGL
jgi:hypothetical protein